MLLYHGSKNKNLKELHSSYGNSLENLEGEGIYFTTDYELAKSYALSEEKEGSVYTVEIEDSSLLDLTTEDGRERFFDAISSQVNYDLRSHDNYSAFNTFLERKHSRNGVGTLADDVVDILKKTSSVSSHESRRGKEDLRARENFIEFCQTVHQAIRNEISQYELHHFKVDHELIYVLKRTSVDVVKEEVVKRS